MPEKSKGGKELKRKNLFVGDFDVLPLAFGKLLP